MAASETGVFQDVLDLYSSRPYHRKTASVATLCTVRYLDGVFQDVLDLYSAVRRCSSFGFFRFYDTFDKWQQ